MRAELQGSWPRSVGPALVGVLGLVLSLARVLIVNGEALTTLMWAEDGLFPLCVLKESVGTCLVDPFAGYLLFLPRVLAGIVATFPMDQWPLVANLLAAGVTGLVAGVVFMVMRRIGVHPITGALVALLPAVAPIVGFEAVQAIGSVNSPLLFAMAVCLAFPARGRLATVLYSLGLIITALTIPNAVVLFIPLIVVAVRRTIPRRSAVIMAAALLVGLLGQAAVILTAPDRRNVAVIWSAVADWVNAMPDAVLTYWPGMSFGDATVLGAFPLAPFVWTGWLIVGGAVGLGLWLVIRGTDRRPGIGSLLLMGLIVGAIPAVTGSANNRYYVVTLLVWGAAALIEIDSHITRRRTLVSGVVVAALLLLWSPAFAASQWRAHSSPDWQAELARARAVCAADPAANVELHFSPDWPGPDSGQTEPTTNVAKCVEIE